MHEICMKVGRCGDCGPTIDHKMNIFQNGNNWFWDVCGVHPLWTLWTTSEILRMSFVLSLVGANPESKSTSVQQEAGCF